MKTTVALIPQPHGGALASGGTPGNKGGGRPSSALREAFRGDLETARTKMLAILEREGPACEECGRGGRARDSDVVAIFDKLAKYSLRERREVVVMTPKVMNELGAVVARFVTDEADRDQIKQEWLDILADYIGS